MHPRLCITRVLKEMLADPGDADHAWPPCPAPQPDSPLSLCLNPTGSSWCRDELQTKMKLLDHELATAKAEQETDRAGRHELEEKLAAEQSSTKQLQEQYDSALQQR